MKQQNETHDPQSPAGPAERKKSIWDNDLPPGESPPLPRWPLIASIVAYSCWMVFLVSMMIVRLTTS